MWRTSVEGRSWNVSSYTQRGIVARTTSKATNARTAAPSNEMLASGIPANQVIKRHFSRRAKRNSNKQISQRIPTGAAMHSQRTITHPGPTTQRTNERELQWQGREETTPCFVSRTVSRSTLVGGLTVSNHRFLFSKRDQLDRCERRGMHHPSPGMSNYRSRIHICVYR